MSACEITGVSASHASKLNKCTTVIEIDEYPYGAMIFRKNASVDRKMAKNGIIKRFRISGDTMGADVLIGFQQFLRWYPLEQLTTQEG